MKNVCQYLGRPVSDKFQIVPPNSVAVLLHWRVLYLISASLQVERCTFWKNFYTGPIVQTPRGGYWQYGNNTSERMSGSRVPHGGG
ncbi:hypothetical protein DPMN_049766 [Dreissena polymorpha]|uniref:Uncharacterized protein n=1 Tax=Dreissena polymorpha TaxID=45954 RepID=A0A9D4CG64_DREPO|nr:hypothetical protein DPMN_049766 [Dreissena polymorpha]